MSIVYNGFYIKKYLSIHICLIFQIIIKNDENISNPMKYAVRFVSQLIYLLFNSLCNFSFVCFFDFETKKRVKVRVRKKIYFQK